MGTGEDVQPRGSGRWIGWTALALGLLAVGAAAVFATRIDEGRDEVTRVTAAARETGVLAVSARHPTAAANASALELERIALAAEVDLRPKSRPGAPAADAPMERDVKEARWVMARFLDARADDRDVAPPPELVTWLSDHAAALDAIERHLVEQPGPRWEVDTARGLHAPLPSLLGQLWLTRILYTRALLAADGSAADRSLQAAWALKDSTITRPELVSHLIGLAQARIVLRGVRETDVPPGPWLERIAALDLPPATRDALDFEIAAGLQAADDVGSLVASDDAGPLQETARGVVAATQRGAVARAVEASLKMRAALEAAEACSDPSELEAEFYPELAQDEVGLEIYVAGPGFASAWARMRWTEVEAELTRRALRTRELRASGALGAVSVGTPLGSLIGPTELPCAEVRFVEEVGADGRARIALDGEMPWSIPTAGTTPPSLHWEESVAASAAGIVPAPS